MEPPVPAITSESEEGFVDLIFAATGVRRQTDGQIRVDAVGKHERQRVGFGVILGPKWERKEAGENFFVQWGTVRLVSLGEPSDTFLRVLDSLYGVDLGADRMKPETSLTAVALEGDPSTAPNVGLLMKLFFEHDDEKRYGEIYLNIDFAAGRVQFREKDEEYRAAVVKGLSKDAG